MPTILIIAAILVYAFISGITAKLLETKLIEEDPKNRDTNTNIAILVGTLWPIGLAVSPIAIMMYVGYWIVGKFQKKNNDTPRSNR